MAPPSDSSFVSHKAIVFPKVPDEVRTPVAPLFREWADIAGEYERRPEGMRAVRLYLAHHPAFWMLQVAGGGLHVASGGGWDRFIEVDFDEDDDSAWMQIQPNYWPEDPTWEEAFAADPAVPDRVLTVTGRTYEKAAVAAAAVVHGEYGNDRSFLKMPLSGRWLG